MRNQPVYIDFKLEKNGSKRPTVYLDDIFFQSQSLKFGNPTVARTELTDTYQNNYLIEKPQYSISYNGEKNTANWVSWVLDGSWPGIIKSEERPKGFAVDSDLEATPFYQVTDDDYNFVSQIELLYNLNDYNQFDIEKPALFWPVLGHMSASNDRNRSKKDMFATFLTTNIVPQDAKGNGGAWKTLEQRLQNLARLKDEQKQPVPYKFYIYSGVYSAGGGKIEQYTPPPTVKVLDSRGRVIEAPPLTNNPNSLEKFLTADGNNTITAPSALWKVVLGFKPYSTSDIPDYYFALWMPNNSYEIQNSLDYTLQDVDGNIIVRNDALKWDELLIPINKLQLRLNADLQRTGSSFRYDFLSNINDPNTKKRLMENTSIIPQNPPEAPNVLTEEEAIN